MNTPSKDPSAINCPPTAPKKPVAAAGLAAHLAAAQLSHAAPAPAAQPQPAPTPVYKIKVPRKAVKEVRLQDSDLVLVLDGNDTFLIKDGARKYAARKPFSLQFADGKVAAGKFIDAHQNVIHSNGEANGDSDSSRVFAVMDGVKDSAASSSNALAEISSPPQSYAAEPLASPVTASAVSSNAIPGNMASPAAITPPLAAVADDSAVAAAPPQAASSGDNHWGLLGIVAALGLAGGGAGGGSNSNNLANSGSPAGSGNPGGTVTPGGSGNTGGSTGNTGNTGGNNGNTGGSGGAGGTGGTDTTNNNNGTPPNTPSTLGTSLQVTPVDGPFLPGVQLLYQVYDSTHQFLLGVTGTAGNKLVLPASFGSGWVLVQVSDTNDSATQSKPDYRDEYSRAPQSLDAPLRAWVEVTQGALTAASVTPLTELAVRLLEHDVQQGSVALNADSMTRYSAQVASLFGISGSLTGSVQPLVDSSGNTLPGNAYGQALQNLSALASARIFGSQSAALAWLSKELSAASSDAARQHIVKGYLAEAEKLLDDQSLLNHPFSRNSLDAPVQFSVHQADVQSGAAQLSDGSSNAQPNAQLPFADARLSPGEVSASATLLLPVPLPPQALAGDVLTLTLHGLQADSSLPVQTLLYTVRGNDALSNYASISLAEVPAAWWTAAMGQRIGIEAQLSGAARQDGLVTNESLTSAAYSVLPGGVLVSNLPATPVLQAGNGVADGATAAEATQASGVFLLTADNGASITVTFSDGTRSISKTLIGQGSAQAVVLDANDIGNGANQLHDGSISVAASAHDAAGSQSGQRLASFMLDSSAPVLQSLRLTSNANADTPLVAGQLITLTASYDSVVFGTPAAPTLTIGSETGVTLSPVITSGNTRSWSYTVSKTGTPDTGAISVVGGDFVTGMRDAAGNPVAASTIQQIDSKLVAAAATPDAPVLALAAQLSDGATAAEALAASGVLTVSAEANSIVTLRFTDASQHQVNKTIIGTGSPVSVQLDATDLGTGANQLHDSLITVVATASNAGGNASSPGLTSFVLDTTAPQWQSLTLTASKNDGTPLKPGDVLTLTASYDDTVLGTPQAPTLSIGTETGIALTPAVTSGNTRSWTYTLSKEGASPDSGVVSVVGGNYLNGMHDAAGNAASAVAGGVVLSGSAFSADSSAPMRPTLTLAPGVQQGATVAEAQQNTGVVLLNAESGTSVVITFTDSSQHSISKTMLATGTDQALVLAASDIGQGANQLHDGSISVSAIATNAAGAFSSPGLASFTLDSVAPVLQSLTLTSSKNNGTPLTPGDVLTLTALYDDSVIGTPVAPTLTIGSETGIALTPVTTSGNTRSWSYTVNRNGAAPDSGAISVVGGNFLTGISDAAGNPASNPASGAPVVSSAFIANSAAPAHPTLTLVEVVENGATASEALNAAGVLTLQADANSTVVLTFSDSSKHSLSKTLIATGSSQAVVLDANDIGNAANQLHDGSINVVAIATNSAGLSSSPAAASFNLDTQAPVMQSFMLDASKTDGTPLTAGDVLYFSISFDENVVGTPVAPTLTIGSESGIALTPLVTSGSTRSWSYTISKGGAHPDNGAVSVVLDSSASGLRDAAGNAVDAAAGTLVLPSAFSVDTSTPAAPVLTLGAGVANGATAAEATQASGIFSFTADAGSTVTLHLVDASNHSISKTFSASGSAQAVVLNASEIGNAASQLHDGPIAVFALASNAAGNSSSASLLSLQLDTVAPKLQSAVLSSSRSDGTAAAIGDELTYTLSYDSVVFGTPTAPTLRIGSETGIAMTPVITSGASRSWRYVLSNSGTPDSGTIAVVEGNYIDGITDAAGNQAVDATSSNGSHGGGGAGGSGGEATPPDAPILTLGEGVADGASAIEAVQDSGVVLLTAQADSTVVVRFSDGQHTLSKTVLATGSAQPLRLAPGDIDAGPASLNNGPIAVWAIATNDAGLSSPATLTSFTLDSVAPVLQSLTLTSSKNDGTPLTPGDVLTLTALYDDSVIGTPVAPTLTIGSETGIALTPVTTSGNSRSWSYTVNRNGAAPDSGAISVVGGNFLSGISDAAGNPASNPASGAPVVSSAFTANSAAPTLPVLTLLAGVETGATASEALNAAGVLTLQADANSTVVLTFSDSSKHSLSKTLIATGSSQAVVLDANDIGNAANQLHDGSINVVAIATNSAGLSSSPAVASFNLDTHAPVLQSLTLTSSKNDGTPLTPGDVLTLTALYDDSVIGTPVAPTLTIGSETGIALTPVTTSGNSRSWSYTVNRNGAAPDSGAISVVGGNFLSGISDAAGNPASNPASGAPVVSSAFTANSAAPTLPVLTLLAGVETGATASEALNAAGVLTLQADANSTVVLTFNDSSNHSLSKTLIATGSSQAVVLDANDIGNAANQLHDGSINVVAIATNSAGLSSSPAVASFNLDTHAPVLQSLKLTSSKNDGTPLTPGDVLTLTAVYDDSVIGTPVAPTLTIGSETGIALTPVTTSGNSRSWSYTVNRNGAAPDSGAISVVGGNFLSGISDAAGNPASNPASGAPVVSSAFIANSAAPAHPTLTLVEVVENGATASEALNAAGVLTLQADANSTVVLTFSDSSKHSLSKTLIATGNSQAVVLDANDIGNAANQLHDGSINVVAIATNSAGLSSSPAAASFNLDTQAPVMQSFMLDASKTDGTPLTAGDVLYFSISFDENVVGTPVAPTLTIGSESGIALTPLVTSGSTRSWSYTISKGGAHPDNGAVSVVLDSSASGLRDAAGNAVDAAAGTLVLPSAFSVDTSTPAAPVLTLGAGVANGATAAEATQASGIFSFTADAGSTVTLHLVDASNHSISKTFSASGSAQAVVLNASEIGNAASQLHDGPIAVFALASNAAGNSSSASLLSLQLDTVAPKLQSAVLSSSRSDGTAAAIGDELTYTLSYDSVVFGTPTAPTLRIGSETGIAMTPVITSGASRSWRYVLSNSGTPDSGTIAVVEGNYIDGITDAAGNQAVDATSSNGSHGGGGAGGSGGEATPPDAPILTLGEGVADGASAIEAVQDSGVVLLTAQADSTVVVRFSDGQHTLSKTVLATGSAQPLVLGDADVGFSLTALRDGPIAVWAVATNAAGLSSTPSLATFTLDTTNPEFLGVVISAAKSEGTPLVAGDVLTITANYDEAVIGTPTAPTLSIGNETGIALTPLVTEGNKRSWTYTISNTGTPDNGSIALEGGNFVSGMHDAAGNQAFRPAIDAPEYTGFYSANSNTPAAPVLHYASGVEQGASAAEATGANGVLTLQAEPGSTVVLTFTDSSQHSIQHTLIANGSEQAVVLNASDIGSGANQLHDGYIIVSATATNAAGTSSSPAQTVFTLDTVAPQLQSLTLSANRNDGTALQVGDVLTLTAQYDDSVIGTPLAPTLTIGSETGIALTPVTTSGNTRSWTYTINKNGAQPDSGTVSVVGGNLITGISDAAGNAASAAAGTLLQPFSFSVDTSTPAAPVLTLGAGVANGATAAEATQPDGIFSFTADAGSTVTLHLVDASNHSIHKTFSATGSAQAVVLNASEIGSAANQLHDGPIAVFATASNAAGNSSSASLLSLNLDTVAPKLQSAVLSSSRSDGTAAAIGDELTYTLSYDSVVFGTPTAPTLTIGSETGIAMTPVITSGASRSWRYVLSNSGTADSGAIAVVDGNYITGITDAAGNQAVDATSSNGSPGGGGGGGGNNGATTPPDTPILTLGSGVADGASATEAVQASGVMLLTAQAGSTVVVRFSDGQHTVTQIVEATGSPQALVLHSADVGSSLTALRNGPIAVWAVATNNAGQSSAPGLATFTLDTVAPQLQSLTLSANRNDGTPLTTGDVLTLTAQYDDSVIGTPLAPTLTIGSETGIALSPVSTSGNTRSWTYTINKNGAQPDSGTVSVVGGNLITGISDAAGNAASAAAGTLLQPFSFSVETSTPATPILTLGSGVADGASATEAVQASGVMLLTAQAGSTVVVRFSDGQHTVTQVVEATGSPQPLVLNSVAVGSSMSALRNGPIAVSAIATNNAGLSSAPGLATFTLDTVAPQLQSLTLSANRNNGTALQVGDVLTLTASYDDSVIGTPAAPTLTIGSETGIALSPVNTSGTTRSWSYTISNSGTADSGAINVVGGNFTATLSDSAGNAVRLPAAGSPALVGSFSADTSGNVLPPAAPVLALQSSIANGATASQATNASGVLTFTAAAQSTVVLTFSDGQHSIHKTLQATGSAQAVVLDASDIGNAANQLNDGSISVSATAQTAAGTSGNSNALEFLLDTAAPAAPALALTAAAVGAEQEVSRAVALQASGVLSFQAEAGSSVTLVLRDSSNHSLGKTFVATGQLQTLTLAASDLGNSSNQLGDGSIQVTAIATDAVGNASSSASSSFTLDTSAPTTTLSGVAFSSDTATTGSSNSDRVTKTATQTISASLSAALASGETLQASLNGGASWNDISNFVSGTQLSWTGVSLLAGANTLQFKVVDRAGNAGVVQSLAYELDNVAPTTVITASAFSADTAVNGGSNHDFITNSATQSISASLSAALGSAEKLYGSVDGGNTWTDISGFVSGQSLNWTGVSLSASNTLLLKVSDAAGNDGTVFSQPYVLDTSGPTSSVSTVSLFNDTGRSSSDLVTSAASQIVQGQLAANLQAGETVQVSVDDGVTWQQASASVGSNLYSLAGATLLPGTHSILAKLSDAAGNDGPVFSQSYVQDSSAPAAPVMELGNGVSDGANAAEATAASGVLTISAEAGSSVQLTLSDGTTSITRSLIGTGAPQAVVLQDSDISGPNALQQGSIRVTASATDLAGNVSPLLNGSFNLDNQLPGAAILFLGHGVANGATAAEATASSGVVNLRAEAGNSVVVTFSVDGHSVSRSFVATGAPQAVTLDASDLGTAANQLPDGTVHVMAVARDAAGNMNSMAETLFVLDTAAPASPGLSLLAAASGAGLNLAEVQANSGVVNIQAEAGSSVQVQFGSGAHQLSKTVLATGSAQSISLTAEDIGSAANQLMDGSISVTAVATDAAGNSSSAASTSFNLDSHAPTARITWAALQSSETSTSLFLFDQQRAVLPTEVGNVSQDLTLETWVTWGAGTNSNLLSLGTAGGTDTLALFFADGKLRFEARNGQTQLVQLTDPATFAQGAWHHVAVTVDGSNLATLYVDGLSVASASMGGSIPAVVRNNNYLGADSNGERSLNGLVADLRIYDSARSVAQIQSDMAGTVNPADSASLVAWYPLRSDGRSGLPSVADANIPLNLFFFPDSLPYSADSAANGQINHDFVTNIANPFVFATLSQDLAAGESVYASLNGGASWTNISSQGLVSQRTISWGGIQLQPGSNTLLLKIADAAGNAAPVFSQTYVLDTTAPGSSVSGLSLSNDTGADSGDFITRVAQQTINASLGAAPAAGETLYGSFDDGAHWTDLSAYLQGSTLRWSGVTLQEGQNTLLLKVTDLAGNDGPVINKDYVLDRSAPTPALLQFGSGVADGATLAEAMQNSGVLLVTAESGSLVTVEFGTGIGVSKTLVGTGTPQAVTLSAADLAFAQANHLQWNVPVQATVTDAAGNSSTVSSSLLLDANPPTANIQIRPSVQNGGASLAEATDANGAFSVSSESGASVLVTLSDGTHTLTQTWVSDGNAHAVTLNAADLGNQAGQLQDGTIRITAVATDSAGNSSSVASASFTLDSVAPTAQVRTQTGLPTSLTGNQGAVLAQPASTIGGDVTVETWFYTDPSGYASNKLFGFDESVNGNRFYLVYDSSLNQFQLFNIAGDGQYQIIKYSMPFSSLLHSWHHLALAVDTSNVATLYLDGMALGNGTLNQALPNVPRIGYAVGTGVIGGQSYNGAFADFRVYDSARSPTQIRADMVTAADPYDANLKLYYLLDGTTNSGLAGSTASATRAGNGDFSFTPFRAVTLSNDSGLSGTDLVTQNPNQTISATLSAHLQAGETLYGSLDDGESWSDLTAYLSGTALQWSGVALAPSGTLQLKVSDVAGNNGPVFSHAYAVDNSAPDAPTLVISNDLSNGGATRAEVLSPAGAVQARGESGSLLTVTFSTIGSSSNVLVKNLIATGELQPVVLSASDIGSGAGQLMDGNINITLRSTDLAGNSSNSPSNSFIFDSVNTTGVLSRPALTLDATNSAAVRLPAAVGNISGDITLETWVYASGPTAQWARIFDIGTGQQSNNILLGFNQGKLAFQAFNGSTSLGSVSAASNFTTNLWQHVAVTVNTSNVVTLYVNGASVATGTLSQAIVGLANGVRGQNYMGQSNWVNDPFFNGSFADARVYDNARSASQIASDMAGGINSSDTNLKAWYPFASNNQSGISGGTAATLLSNPVFNSPGSLAFSTDTTSLIGTGSHDFNTRTASQTISGTLNANLGQGETVFVSLDDGNTWTAATASTGSTAWSLATNLLPGNHNLVVKVTDLAGNDGPVFTQPYALDTSAPTQTLTINSLSADTAANGTQNSDFITKVKAQTIRATLSAPLTGDGRLYASVNGGFNWTDVSSYVTGTTLDWPTTLQDGTSSVVLKLGDLVGNTGQQIGMSYTVDNTAPLGRFEDHPGLALKAANQQYAALPGSAGVIGGDITLEAWVYAAGTPAQYARILDLGSGAAVQNIILGFSGGKLFFEAYNSGSLGQLQDTHAFATNTWNHVAVTVGSNNAVTLYVNGVQELTGTLSGSMATATRGNNYIGHSNWATDPYFNGSISDVRIYDNARSSAQILSDMTGAVDTSDSNLKGYYPLNNTSASGIPGGIAATYVGSPVYSQLSPLSFSADTGNSSSDFITRTAQQTISARLYGTLDAGDRVYGSLDSGATWSDVSAFMSGNTLTWTGATLPTANVSQSVQLKVSDAAGNDGPLLIRNYLLDTIAPSLGAAISNIVPTSSTGNVYNILTLTGTLGGSTQGATLGANEVLSVYEKPDGSSDFHLVGNATVTTTPGGQSSWSFFDNQTLPPALTTATYAVGVTDVAGNAMLSPTFVYLTYVLF